MDKYTTQKFNRNILYCKCMMMGQILEIYLHLIETFCIVNEEEFVDEEELDEI